MMQDSFRRSSWVTMVAMATAVVFAACGGRVIAGAVPDDSGLTVLDATAAEVTAQPTVDASSSVPTESSSEVDGQVAVGPDDAAVDASSTMDATHPALDGSTADGAPDPIDATSEADATSPPIDDSGIALPDLDGLALPDVTCDSGAPVPICVDYYALLSKCFNTDYLSECCQASLIPDSGSSLLNIEQICAVNLQRMQKVCM